MDKFIAEIYCSMPSFTTS